MPTSVGPDTFGEDNLVFGYDTGDAANSYIGAPVRNYIHGQNAVYQDTYTAYEGPGSNASWIANHPYAIRAYNAAGGDITGYVNTGVGSWETTHHAHWQHDPVLGKPVVVMNDVSGQWKAKSFGTGMGSWNSYGKGYGDTYTISWLQWVDHLSKNAKAGLYSRTTTGSNGFHDGQANSPSSYNTKLRTWQRVYQTYTTASSRDLDSTYLSIYMYGHYNVRATVKIADVQFNWGSYPAQFHDGAERTATEGLIDLTGNSTIDLTNVSFDSNAQMTFDGTDDNLDADLQFNYNNFSVEMVASWDSLSDLFCAGSGAAGAGLTGGTNFNAHMTTSGFYVRAYSPPGGPGGWNTSGTVSSPSSTNTTYHITVVNIGTVWYFYKNGTLAGSVDALYTPNSASTRVGIFRNHVQNVGNAGDVYMFKAYNKALTASEIKANYNAIKGRFNI